MRPTLLRTLAAASLITLLHAAVPARGLAIADPALVGQWTPPRKWPAVAVHLIMLHTGKVLFFRGDQSVATAYVWDPATEAVVPTAIGVDVFCAGHAFLPDGRVLVTGGALYGGLNGSSHSAIFDPVTSQWTTGPEMRRGRFYPTTVSTADGRVFVFAGKDATGKADDQVEVFDQGAGPAGTDVWDLVSGASKTMALYPRMLLLDDGTMLHVGEEPVTDVFDPATSTWRPQIATSNFGTRYEGSAVMLPPGHDRIMIMGGGSKSGAGTNTAEILDLSQSKPAWRYTNPMHAPRLHVDNVILPDGRIYVAGGDSLTVEIFDPPTETWNVVAPLGTTRGYHSSAVLLPDARVLQAGANGNPSREIYSPPYLFRGPRPVIAAAPESLRYGQAFSLRTPQAASIASVVLIRLGAYTHAANMEQRFVPLAFAPGDADTLDVTAPVDGNVAPPGYYMLFIVDRDGVPSVAPFVLLGPAAPPPPRIPSPSTTTTTSLHTTSTSRTTTSTTRSTTSTSRSTTSTSHPTTSTSRSTTSTSRPTTSTSRTTSTTSSTSSTIPGAATTESRILASADDAEEQATGKIKLTSSTLDLVHDVDDQIVGLRFTRIDVPRGATIVNAWVQFKVQTVQTEPTSLVVQGQAADTAPTFTSTVRGVSSRPRTTAAVAWGPIAPWLTTRQAGPDQRTPNLAAVLQEIVDRPGWARGNALVLIITGRGHRGARSFDLDPAGAPLLHVEYLPAGIPTTTSTTSTSSSSTSSSTSSTSSTSTTASSTSTSSTESTTSTSTSSTESTTSSTESTTSTSSTEPEPTTSTSTTESTTSSTESTTSSTESTVDSSTTSTVPEP